MVVAYLLLCLASFGIFAGNPLFWSLSSAMMTGTAGAAAIGFINSVAQFGGLIGPWMIGRVKEATGSFEAALLALAAFLLFVATIAFLMRVAPRPAHGHAANAAARRA